MNRSFSYGILAGLLLGWLWLRATAQPDPRAPKPGAGRFYTPGAGTAPGKVIVVDTEADELGKASGE